MQTTTTQVFISVTDEDTLPPVFKPCDGGGADNVCIPPLYTAVVTLDQDGVSLRTKVLFFYRLILHEVA